MSRQAERLSSEKGKKRLFAFKIIVGRIFEKDNEKVKYLIVVLLDCFDVGCGLYSCACWWIWKSKLFADQQIEIRRFPAEKSRLTVLR